MNRGEQFLQFLSARAADFARLARLVREPREDIEQSAWIVVGEIEQEAGDQVDFSDTEQQDRLLDAIRKHWNRIRGKLPRFLSLDEPIGGEDSSEATYVDYVPAEAGSDPIETILSKERSEESRSQFLEICRKSFSQFSAYLLLFLRDEGDDQPIANELGITRTTLKQRLKRLLWSYENQPSLFDGIAQVMPDFLPMRPKTRVPRFRRSDPVGPLQLEFRFPHR